MNAKKLLLVIVVLLVLAACSPAPAPATTESAASQPSAVATEEPAVVESPATSEETQAPAASETEASDEALDTVVEVPTAVNPYPGPVASPTPVPDFYAEGYPGPAEAPQSALSEPAADATPLVIPTPAAGSGIVLGRLTTSDGEPYLNDLYLAKAIKADREGFPPMVSFSETEDPKAVQDSDGQFLFTDVPPGSYALVLWTPVTNVVIQDPAANDNLIIDVPAGETLDLGEILIP